MHVAPAVSAMNKESIVMPLAADKNVLLAQFGFDEDLGLVDSSVNNVRAELVDPGCIIGTGYNDSGAGNGYPDLTNSNDYLSMDGSILKGLEEMTVEMRVKSDAVGANCLYFNHIS